MEKANRSIALLDIDRTIYDGFILMDVLSNKNDHSSLTDPYKAKINEVYGQYKSGNIDYETAIAQVLAIWAEGLKTKQYNDILKESKDIITFNKSKFFAFVRPTIDLLRRTHDIYLITGEPQFIAQAVAEMYEVNGFRSTQFRVINSVFTGEIETQLADRYQKEEIIQHLIKQYGSNGSIALGDSEGDIMMLNVVQHPLCINPNPELRKIAESNNWTILEPEQVESHIRKIL